MYDLADPVQFYSEARTQQMTTLHKAKKVIALFTCCRRSEMDLGFRNYLFICVWDCFACFADFGLGFLFCFSFVHRSLLPK